MERATNGASGPPDAPHLLPIPDFTGVPVRSATVERLQPRLAARPSGDVFEQEADQVAEHVVGMAPAVSPPPRPHERGTGAQRATAVPTASSAVPAEVDDVVRSPGQPLEPVARAFMEQRFGRDFSGVRVHTDVEAARSAQSVQALAYTVGKHIAFAPGTYAPATHVGRRLLAHELTHVAQQTEARGAGASPRLQRQQAPAQGTTKVPPKRGFVIYLADPGGDRLAAELLRRGILKPGQYDTWRFGGDGYYFAKVSGTGPTASHIRVLEAMAIFNAAGVIIGFRIVSHLPGQGQGDQPGQPGEQKPVKGPAQLKAEFEALPEPVKALLKDAASRNEANLERVMRIATKLDRLAPEDQQVYKPLAKHFASDLDAFERSIDAYVEFKSNIKAQADAERKGAASDKEGSGKESGKEVPLEQRLAKTWSRFDEKKFAGMSVAQKEELAREVAAEQRNIQLEYMAEHPGETAVGMAEGMVRPDKAAARMVDDVKEAADGKRGAYARLASVAGAYNKYVAAAASAVFVALLFVPFLNLLEMAAVGLVVAAATIAASAAESELRIKAAGEAKSPEELKAETAGAAEAQVRIVVTAAMLALMVVAKIVARIPLPGRYQNVGAALNAAQNALLEKTGIGPAWQAVKADLLGKLRASKQGLPEALAEQTNEVVAEAKYVESMSGEEFVQHLADGDPKLADLGIPPAEAKGVQQMAAATPKGANIAEQLRRNTLQALQEAPAEAAKKVDTFVKGVDGSIEEVAAAKNPEQLKAAIEQGKKSLGPENQARQALAEEQAFMKKRMVGARRRALEEDARNKLNELSAAMAETQRKIAEVKEVEFAAKRRAIELKRKVDASPAGSDARAAAEKELAAAKEVVAELEEQDELEGYREQARTQKQEEGKVFEALGLGRPNLWAATKAAIRKAAKTLNGKFLDANTEEVIEGTPEYGHKWGKENRRLVLEAAERGMSQEQFNRWVNEHPEWFQLETLENNRSRRFEKPGVD
ncbi:DUF4157 domain-containing protein [Streptomyces sp. NPDC056634]|uniref:eCIS core domain-containing protein n=1 Tax=Streptomyces sp. NPDC056634 TaxID=3345885 RepID=UPI0036CCD96A